MTAKLQELIAKYPEYAAYARLDQLDRRGGPICAKCGGKTRTVLDGEAWCDACGRYQ